MTLHLLRRLTGTAALLGAALLASCESPTGGGAGAPARMDVVAGDLQTATAGTELPQALVVRVLDDQGRPVPQQIVNFVVITGGGRVFAGASSTNAQGEARERWTLGTVAGDTQRVEVRAVDPATGAAQVFAVFRAVATPDAPATITPVNGASYTGIPGFPLADSLGARVTDRYGNRVAGTTVAWTVQRGGGSVSPATSLTDTSGVARAQWMLGAGADSTHVLQAAAGVGVTTAFTASSGVPAGARLVVVSGDAQTGIARTALAQPLVVKLTLADGRPVPGATVAWSVSGGTVTPSVSTTDAAGQASAQWVLPSTAGALTATASTPGVMAVGFTATSTFGPPATLQIVSGNNQSGHGLLGEFLTVRVLDAQGNALEQVPVDWTTNGGRLRVVGGGSGTVVRSYTTAGLAQVLWESMTDVGPYQVTATVGAMQVTFNVTALSARIFFVDPEAGRVWGDSVPVRVNVVANTAVTSVTARVGDGTVATLSLTSGYYTGVVRLDGVPRGTHDLVVTVNTQGAPPVTGSRPVVVDRRPVVRVELPLNYTVSLTGSVHVRATCEDDDPAGCASIEVYRTSVRGTSSIDATVVLPNGSGTLAIIGRDSRGQQTEVGRSYIVETNAPWTEVARAPGGFVIDTDGARALWYDADSSFAARPLRLRTAGGATVRLSGPGWTDARLSADAAVWMSDGRTWAHRGGATYEIGQGSGGANGSLRVAGNFAAWTEGIEGTGVLRHDLAAGTTVRVGGTSFETRREIDVAANGDVVWVEGGRVMRWRDGAAAPLTVPDNVRGPVTDGINTAYYGNRGSLVLTGPDGTSVLGSRTETAIGWLDVRVRNGWTAYTRIENGVERLYTRSPSGEVRQAAAAADFIKEMGPAGEVIFAGSGGRMYYTAPPYATARDVGPTGGVAWPGATPYAMVYGYVFRIDP